MLLARTAFTLFEDMEAVRYFTPRVASIPPCAQLYLVDRLFHRILARAGCYPSSRLHPLHQPWNRHRLNCARERNVLELEILSKHLNQIVSRIQECNDDLSEKVLNMRDIELNFPPFTELKSIEDLDTLLDLEVLQKNK